VSDKTWHDDLTPGTSTPFRDIVFPELQAFAGDVEGLLSHYPAMTLEPVTESLLLHQRAVLHSWVDSPHSSILWIDGCKDRSDSDWTSDLSLEVIGATIQATTNMPSGTLCLLYHFCGKGESGARKRPEIVLQDLLFQIIQGHAKMFDQSTSRKYNLTRLRLQEAANNCDELWRLLKNCIQLLGIASLVIVLDNIDSLYKDSRGDPNLERGYDALIDAILRSLPTGMVTNLKVLVTTRLPGATKHCSRRSRSLTDSTRFVLLTIPKAPDRKPARRRISRIPNASKPLNMVAHHKTSRKNRVSKRESKRAHKSRLSRSTSSHLESRTEETD
jgi:hypothetical protein